MFLQFLRSQLTCEDNRVVLFSRRINHELNYHNGELQVSFFPRLDCFVSVVGQRFPFSFIFISFLTLIGYFSDF